MAKKLKISVSQTQTIREAFDDFLLQKKAFSMTHHVFTVEPVTMNLDLWNSLTAEEQEAVQKSFDEAADYQIKLAQETEENQLNKVLSEGADIVVTYIDDLTPFKDAARRSSRSTREPTCVPTSRRFRLLRPRSASKPSQHPRRPGMPRPSFLAKRRNTF